MNNYELRPIDVFKVPTYYIRSLPNETEIQERADGIASSGIYPSIIAVEEYETDAKHEILDGIISWYALKKLGVEMVTVKFVPVAPDDRAFRMIQLNYKKYVTHRELALMLPVLDDHYERHLNGKGIIRKSKFISEQFRLIGFRMSQNNIDKFREIVDSNKKYLLDRLDSRARQLESTHKLLGKKPEGSEIKKPTADKNPEEQPAEQVCAPCAPGLLIPFSVTVNNTTREYKAGDFCATCKLHPFIMQATNNLPGADAGERQEDAE